MPVRLRSMAALTLAVSMLGTGTACDSCGDVNCGPGLMVWWTPNAVPVGDYQLCIDAQCEPVGAHRHSGVQVVEPTSSSAGAGDTITLIATTSSGSVTRYSGSGSLRGKCCKAITLRASSPGQLLDERFD
jgi:hypothetical protein